MKLTLNFFTMPGIRGVLAGALALALCNAASAAIVITPNPLLNVQNAGQDLHDTNAGPAASVAPDFTGLIQVPRDQITTSASSNLGGANPIPRYSDPQLNDGTGFTYMLDDEQTNRGWIPDVNAANATLTFASPVSLAGLDFLTLFVSRTSGSYAFEYSTDGLAFANIVSLTQDSSTQVFRQGFTFDPVANVTNVRLTVAGADVQPYIGEIVVYQVPEPSTLALGLGAVAVALLAGRRRLRRAG